MKRWACVSLALFCWLCFTPVAVADPTPAQAIAELNSWRAQLGEQPVSSSDVAAWDTGCQHHNSYEERNGMVLAHPETQGDPGYTTAGAIAGPDSVLAEEINEPHATPDWHMLPGPVWDGAVFHRAALLEPRLARTGFNSETFDVGGAFYSWQCMWVQNQESPAYGGVHAIDDARTTPALTLYPSPANGAYDVPTKFPGGELPNPTTETGVPAGATLGWLMNVEINGPWSDGGGGGIVWADVASATLEPDGTSDDVPLVISQCGAGPCSISGSSCVTSASGATSYGCYFGGGFGLFPTQPLAANTTYHVQASGTVEDDNAEDRPFTGAFNLSWCFSTGSSYTPSSDCHASSTSAGIEPAVVQSGGSPAAHAGKPTLSHASLTLGKKPKLAFTLTAGKHAPALASVSISLPAGLSFSHKARKSVALAGHPAFSSSVAHGTLTLTLAAAASRLGVTVSGAGIAIGNSLARKLRHHKTVRLTITVRVVDAGGKATSFRLAATVR